MTTTPSTRLQDRFLFGYKRGLAICRTCSTRATAVIVAEEEQAEHHAMHLAEEES